MLYRLDADALAIGSTFGASQSDDPWAGGHVAPGNFAPIVTAGREFIAGPSLKRGEPRIIPRVWGVPPPPNALDPSRGIMSVRNPDSPFWIGNLRNSEFRCMIPATTFMEWGKGTDSDGRRRQHWFAPSDQNLFGFAGVWKDSEVPSFALLSCKSNSLLKTNGCDWMPVLLAPDETAREIWLHGDWREAQVLLQPYASSLIREIEPPAKRSA